MKVSILSNDLDQCIDKFERESSPGNSSLSDITPEYTWLDVANQTVKLDADDSILVAN